jgi:molecular chaperone HscB
MKHGASAGAVRGQAQGSTVSKTNPFSTFGIAERFDLDLPELERTHRELSRAVHPDRVASSAARKDAVEQAMQVNEAFRILRDPVKRAEALFTLRGVPVGETSEPKPAPAFLMEVLEQREALSEAREAKDPVRVSALEKTMRDAQADVERRLAAALAPHAKDPGTEVGLLGELRFYRRFLEEVSAIQDELAD